MKCSDEKKPNLTGQMPFTIVSMIFIQQWVILKEGGTQQSSKFVWVAFSAIGNNDLIAITGNIDINGRTKISKLCNFPGKHQTQHQLIGKRWHKTLCSVVSELTFTNG